MQTFSEIIATLDPVDHIARIELHDANGKIVGTIENKPGSAGSVKLYHHLWKKHGNINLAAATDGLELYAEHTDDAAEHPGKHPNIDRLFEIVANKQTLVVKIIPQTLH
jgi:hypothetical protein